MVCPEIDCPFCGEPVKAVAKKCRHCGEWLKSGQERGVLEWKGQNVVLPAPGELYAAGCVICGDERAFPTQRKFTYVPTWIYIFTPIIGIGVALVAHIVRKEASLMLPLCRACKTAWTRSKWVFGLYAVLGLFAAPALGGYLGYGISRDGALPGVLIGFLAWGVGLFLIHFLYVNRKQASCREITDQTMTLRFPRPRLLERLVKEAQTDSD